MSEAPSTSSLEVLKDWCVQEAVLRENFNHRHTNIDHKAQVRHMHPHSGTVGAHQNLNAPAKKKNQHACEIISHSQTRPKNQPSLSPCPPCHHRLPFWQSRPFLASCILIPALHISDAATQLRESRFINNLWLDWKENLMIDLGKPQRKFISVHLGIARLGGGSKPLPGWFVAPIFRRNVLVQTGICMILPENRCHRVPVWQRGGGPMAIWAMPKWTAIFFRWGFPKGRLQKNLYYPFNFQACH